MKNKLLDTKSLVLCALFTALIAAGAFIKVPVPLVPFTLQFLFTNLAGLLLGKKRGLISVLLYIFIGLAGIPVFTQGGGPGYVLQPTFGYILGMALGTWLAGLIAERGGNSIKTYLIAGAVNLAVVYGIGMIYLYLVKGLYLGTPISISNLLIYCCLIFVPGDGLSFVLGAIIAKRLKPVLNKEPEAKIA